MKTVYDIIIAPVITEDSMAMSADKKYAFKVLSDATKPEIAAAVEKAFKVDVKCVNIINVRSSPDATEYTVVTSLLGKRLLLLSRRTRSLSSSLKD